MRLNEKYLNAEDYKYYEYGKKGFYNRKLPSSFQKIGVPNQVRIMQRHS